MGIDLDVSFCHCDSLKSDRKEKVRDPKEGKIKKSQKPNLLINLTYLAVTTLAFARPAPTKTQVIRALGGPCRAGKKS